MAIWILDIRSKTIPKIIFMERSKIVAIITGAISILLAIAYLVLVQLLDLRGEMKPAPISEFSRLSVTIASSYNSEFRYPCNTASNNTPASKRMGSVQGNPVSA